MDIELKNDYVEVTSTGVNDLLNPKLEMQNYPNPFNPTTMISFSLTMEFTENAELIIYDVKGQKVKQFSDLRNQTSVVWDGKNNNGKDVSSGVYFYKLKAGKFEQSRKMILLK